MSELTADLTGNRTVRAELYDWGKGPSGVSSKTYKPSTTAFSD